MITLIIPTTDYRDKLLDRALNYYSKFSVKIIVADGSKNRKKIRYKNVEYFHYPGINLEQRLLMVVKKTSDNFILISQDDDFINFSVVKKAMKILNENNDIAWVSGDQIYFHKFFGKYLFKKLKDNNHNDDFKSNNLQNRSLFFLKYQQQLMASLFKKQPLIRALKDYSKLDILIYKNKNKINVYYETIFSIFISFYGKYHHINDIFQFRDLKVYPNPNSRPSMTVTFEDVKNSKATRNLKKYLYKKIPKKQNFSKIFNDSINYRKNEYGNNTKYNLDKFKNFLKKNLFPIFFVLKLINYFFYLIEFLYINCIKKKFSKYKNFSNYWKNISVVVDNFEENLNK